MCQWSGSDKNKTHTYTFYKKPSRLSYFRKSCLGTRPQNSTQPWQKIYQDSRQGFGPPVPAPVISGGSAWGHDHKIPHSRDKRFIKIRVKGLDPPFPPQLFQEIVPGDTTTKFHTAVTKDLSKFASRVWAPRAPIDSCKIVFRFSLLRSRIRVPYWLIVI